MLMLTKELCRALETQRKWQSTLITQRKSHVFSATTDFLPWDNLGWRDTKNVSILMKIDSGKKQNKTKHILGVFDIKLKIQRRNYSKYSA